MSLEQIILVREVGVFSIHFVDDNERWLLQEDAVFVHFHFVVEDLVVFKR